MMPAMRDVRAMEAMRVRRALRVGTRRNRTRGGKRDGERHDQQTGG